MSLIQNNNKKPLLRLALRNLKAHRFRTLSIVTTIFLCACLMTALPLINTISFLQINADSSLKEHASYINLTQEQLDVLSSDPHFSSTLLFKEGEIVSADTEYVRMIYSEPANSSIAFYQLLSGSHPAAYYDAVIEQSFADLLGLSIGDAIACAGNNGQKEVFTVCGIADTKEWTSTSCLYVSKTYADHGSLLSDVSYALRVRLCETYDNNSEANELLLRQIGEEHSVSFSDIVIHYPALYSNPLTFTHLSLYFFLDLICLSIGILVIYSIFSLSVMARIPEFGQMSTLGMSQKQLSKMVRYEGRFLCLFGLIPGILAGAFFSWLITGFWTFRYFLFFSVFVFLISYLFIMFCLKKPIKEASFVSPISAQKYDGLELDKNFFSRSSHQKLTPKVLAHMRFCKERKKSFFAILSMIVGGSLFLLGSTYITSVDMEKMARRGYFQDAEYQIQYASDYQDVFPETELLDFQKQNILNEELIEELYEIPDIAHVIPVHMEQVSYDYEGITMVEDMSMVTKDTIAEAASALMSGSADYEMLVRENGVIYTGSYYEIPFQVGDVITLTYYNGENYTQQNVSIAGITVPEYFSDHITQGTFLAPKELMEKMFPGINTTKYLFVQTVNHIYNESIDHAVKAVVSRHDFIRVDTFSDYYQEMIRQNQILIVLIVLGSFFVILFGLINILNTMISAMLSRDTELALLEAVGMEEKQIKKMLVYECLHLCIPSVLFSLLLGGIGGFLLIRLLFQSQMTYLTYHFPFAAALLYVFFAILVPVGVALSLNRRFRKKDLMSRLKGSD